MLFGLITFGGIIFWVLFALFLLLESAFIYSNKNSSSLWLLGIFIALCTCCVSGWPDFNWKLLSIYPVMALLWLPVYWYLEMQKTAQSIKATMIKVQASSLADLESKLTYRSPLHRHLTVKGTNVEANIQHPYKADLTSNAVFWPISIPVFFGDSLITMAVDTITEWMEEVRKNINAKVNNFNV